MRLSKASLRLFCTTPIRPVERRVETLSGIGLVRAAHLNLYLDLLRKSGAPVERYLRNSELPSRIEDMPDAYVSVDMAFECVRHANRELEPMVLGCLAAQQSTFDTLSPTLRTALLTAPTPFRQLRAFVTYAPIEDSALAPRVRREGRYFRVICNIEGYHRHSDLCYGEWLNVRGVLDLLQVSLGPGWRPEEITFVSSGAIPDAFRSRAPNTRVLSGQTQCSVLVEADLLMQTFATGGSILDVAPAELQGEGEYWTFLRLLKSAIAPYIGDTYPSLPFAAELMRTSPRTLQRQLKRCNKTYTEVIQDVRFDIARNLLSEPSMKIIDVALTAGYENPQHFTRAFRRVSGVTPTFYRRTMREAS